MTYDNNYSQIHNNNNKIGVLNINVINNDTNDYKLTAQKDIEEENVKYTNCAEFPEGKTGELKDY